jgi:hypothetical protein
VTKYGARVRGFHSYTDVVEYAVDCIKESRCDNYHIYELVAHVEPREAEGRTVK